MSLPRYTLVTGASGGIGLELVKYFLQHGEDKIACHYHTSADKLAETLAAGGLDPQRHLFQADLTSETDVRNMRAAIHDRFGTLWGLVNLAGRSSNSMMWKLTLADFRDVLEGNVVTTFLTCREFVPEMRDAGGGRIVNISSVVASIGAVGAAHYGAAKAAVSGLTRSMALEVANKNITVNTVSLGYFEHGMIALVPPDILARIKTGIPLARLGKGSEVASLIFYLLGEESAFVTGQTLHANGGQYL